LRAVVFWVITQQVVVISYEQFGTIYYSHLQGSRIQKKACCPDTDFIQGRGLGGESLSSMVSANRIDASGWNGEECGSQCSFVEIHFMTEEILTWEQSHEQIGRYEKKRKCSI